MLRKGGTEITPAVVQITYSLYCLGFYCILRGIHMYSYSSSSGSSRVLQAREREGSLWAVICKELVGIANNGATGHNAMVRLPGIYGARGGRSAYEPSCALLLWEQEQCVGVQPGGCRCSLLRAVLPASACPPLPPCAMCCLDRCLLAGSVDISLDPFYCTCSL